MASASLYFVVNHLPPGIALNYFLFIRKYLWINLLFFVIYDTGADQLAAAKLCFLHAQQWVEQEKSEKAEAGFVKVRVDD